jgi:hypothetical protein
MKAEDKIREAINNYQNKLDACIEARMALVTATEGANEAFANAQRVMHAVLGDRAKDGVVFGQKIWWLDERGSLCNEPFSATVL